MRKHYIDNLRNLTILLLFPVHTLMVWNDFGSKFYIWQGGNRLLSTCIVLVNPWFMPLLFGLAGISARHALEKRSVSEFVKERVYKLLLPFLFGTVFLVPVQTLFARKFFHGYEGGWFENWAYFFTHITDLSGYDGAFTPGQLWFILFLFLVSMFSLILFHFLPYKKTVKAVARIPAAGVLMLFVPIWLLYYLGNFGGFSLGKSLALFLAGYYILSNDAVMKSLEKNMKWLAALCAVGTVLLVTLYYNFAYYGDLWASFIGWLSILVLLALGKRFLDKKTKFTSYFNKASFSIYIWHQSILVVLAYYVLQWCDMLVVQIAGICIGSFIWTVLLSHLLRLCYHKKRITR